MASREAGPGAPGAPAPEVGTIADPGISLQPREAAAPVLANETSATAVAAREKASVEARFVMALNRPRNPEQARLRILDACKRARFAESARYSKPLGGGKAATGLSVRFAEEAGRAWGNLSVVSMIVFDDAERRIYRVVGTDLETNWSAEQDVVVEKFVERLQTRPGDEILSRRTNSQGKVTYRIAASEDALLTKANALVSKQKRNVILDLIPADVQEEAEEQIIYTLAHRDTADPAASRKRILDAFWTLGVTPQQIVECVGKPLEQLNPAEMGVLRTLYTAIKDGETTWQDAEAELAGRFGGKVKETPAEAPKKGADRLKERLGATEKPAATTAEDLELDRTLAAQEKPA